ncbi:MAG: aldo/keto reductase [Actinomycetota bacterium]|nr:aldo/keto reductase [Actinomycetota bacterium]
MTDFALGLAALGRPAYINVGRDAALPAQRTVEAMRENCHQVLDVAYASGIRRFDAARSYGLSEQFLGEWLDSRGHIDVVVSSKWGYAYVADWRCDVDVHEVKEHSLERFTSQWQESCALLGDRTTLYQVHSLTLDSSLFDDNRLLDALAHLRDRGVRIGFSTSGPRQGDTIRRGLDLVRGERLFDAVQATWNVYERSAGAALQEVHDAGLQVLVKEPLANGLLAVEPPPEVAALASEQGVGPDAVALAFVAAQPWADTVLIGAAGARQLRANLAARQVRVGAVAFSDLVTDPEAYWQQRARLRWR